MFIFKLLVKVILIIIKSQINRIKNVIITSATCNLQVVNNKK